jgi:hypothetical protein
VSIGAAAAAEVDAAAAVAFVEGVDDVVGIMNGVFVVERVEECWDDELVLVAIVD